MVILVILQWKVLKIDVQILVNNELLLPFPQTLGDSSNHLDTSNHHWLVHFSNACCAVCEVEPWSLQPLGSGPMSAVPSVSQTAILRTSDSGNLSILTGYHLLERNWWALWVIVGPMFFSYILQGIWQTMSSSGFLGFQYFVLFVEKSWYIELGLNST